MQLKSEEGRFIIDPETSDEMSFLGDIASDCRRVSIQRAPSLIAGGQIGVATEDKFPLRE